MSIEQALAENTAALRDLIARLTASPTAVVMTATEFLQDHNKGAPAPLVEEVKKPVVSQAAETPAASSATVTESPSETAALDYTKDIKPILIKVSKDKGRDALIALLSKFGVFKGDELPVAKLNAVLADANELLAA